MNYLLMNLLLIPLELGQMLVKWISSSITKTHNLNENDLLAIERLVAVICTHLIEAGVMKQIVDNNENVQCAFCVSFCSLRFFCFSVSTHNNMSN